MVTLQNKELTVRINEKGAEMLSVTAADGTEYLWCGDPSVWGKHAPVLFPICGRLKNDEYRHNGKTYALERHGYARTKMFEVEMATDTKAVFVLRSDESSRTCYPFEYEFRIGYELTGRTVAITYAVTNLAKEPMYMSVGSHEGYACPEGIEEYEIVFPEPETLYTTPDPLTSDDRELVLDNSTVLPLKEDYFAIDALIFRGGTRSNSLQLRHKQSGRGVEIRYEGFEHLLLWQPHKAPFLCIEPWCGYPDTCGHNGNLADKVGIQCIEGGDTFSRVHTITLL